MITYGAGMAWIHRDAVDIARDADQMRAAGQIEVCHGGHPEMEKSLLLGRRRELAAPG